MELQPSVIFAIEIIGTIAFASSGAMVAVRKKLDLFGIIVLGVITAVGGGMLRDILIGNIPPNMFRNPVYVLAAFLTVLVLFMLFRFWPSLLGSRYMESYERIMNILDAIGLGAFTVIGIDTGVEAGVWQLSFPDYLPGGDHRYRRRYSPGYYGGGNSLCAEKAYLCLCFYRRGVSVRGAS